MISLLLIPTLPIAALIAIGCGGKKKEPPAGGAPGSAPGAGGAPPAGGAAPAGGEKTGGAENKTALDGMSQTGATGGGTQA